MNPYRAASIKSLTSLKDITVTDAKLIRAIWKATSVDQVRDLYPATPISMYAHNGALSTAKREAIDHIFGTHGVEYLGRQVSTSDEVFYCNAGDVYAPTIAFIGLRLVATTLSDLVESDQVRDLYGSED